MKILIACEYSGVVRDAFRAKGHDAWSCDLLPTEGDPTFHYQMNVLKLLNTTMRSWDMMIAFPPCTHLASSGARWFKDKEMEQLEAIDFVKVLMNQPIPRIAIENPIGVLSTKIRKPNQIIQPWMFGHGETKATCLWLKNLPKLNPSKIVKGRYPRIHLMPPGPNRSKERGRTYKGIAVAMANQWG